LSDSRTVRIVDHVSSDIQKYTQKEKKKKLAKEFVKVIKSFDA
jgi:hypothetical protein